MSNTGRNQRLYENVLAEIFAKQSGSFNELSFRQLLENSRYAIYRCYQWI